MSTNSLISTRHVPGYGSSSDIPRYYPSMLNHIYIYVYYILIYLVDILLSTLLNTLLSIFMHIIG